jgi:hypothetical protein
MSLRVGFAEIDITPPLRTHKIGWLRDIIADRVLDPLFARVAVLVTSENQVAVVQLDTLFVAWPEVAAIRKGISEAYGFPGAQVLVAATHNHAGPAVTHAGDVAKDEAYARDLVARVIEAFGAAMDSLDEAEIGMGSGFEWRVAHNRRVVMRDGTVRTHGTFDDPSALCLEGPVDPEVAVIAMRDGQQELLGAIVNYACHPTHHGPDDAFSAGFPGVVAAGLKKAGCPVTLFLNGASGNIHTADPCAGGQGLSQEAVGELLADDVLHVIDELCWQGNIRLGASSRVLDLDYRAITEQEISGHTRGAQRFVDTAIYDRQIPALVDKIRERKVHRAEIQALGLGDWAIVGVPGEYFCEFGLQIKEAAYPVHALVASCANGRVGYIPTVGAFRRGGYETTFGPSSMLAPDAGEVIAKTAVELINGLRSC